MDETGVILSMLSSLKVLVGKDDLRTYRGAGVKRTMVTAIERISIDTYRLRTMLLDGILRALNLAIPILRSAWTDLSLYPIPKLNRRRTRNHGFLFITASGHISRSRSWNIALKIRLSFTAYRRTLPISSSPVTSEFLAR